MKSDLSIYKSIAVNGSGASLMQHEDSYKLPKFYLFNSLTGKKEEFVSKEPGIVRMYVCGITSYDYSHVGHARGAVVFDILVRYLQHLGNEVVYVRNFTDIDNKLFKKANEEMKDALFLSNYFCEEYIKDLNTLHCLRPTYEPRVSAHMDQIINMITKIIENGFAYESQGDVYYSVDKFPDYGCFSRKKVENNEAGKRVAINANKQNPADFTLWKAAKKGEIRWDSPWGFGRPGWHIECSAMSAHYLSYSFDIHGGGEDLKENHHHENEIAQSFAACPDTNVTYWVHNGAVNRDDGKMSKSKGNSVLIREVTELYHPLVVRYFLMSAAHYRSDLLYSQEQLEIAIESVFYLYETMLDYEEVSSFFSQQNLLNGAISLKAQDEINKLQHGFYLKMSDDLHTAEVLKDVLKDALTFMNKSLKNVKMGLKKQTRQEQDIRSLIALQNEIKKVLGILGLLWPCTCSEVIEELKDKALKRAQIKEELLLHLISEADDARKRKDYGKSDQIREDLKSKGIGIMYECNQTNWRPTRPSACP